MSSLASRSDLQIRFKGPISFDSEWSAASPVGLLAGEANFLQLEISLPPAATEREYVVLSNVPFLRLAFQDVLTTETLAAMCRHVTPGCRATHGQDRVDLWLVEPRIITPSAPLVLELGPFLVQVRQAWSGTVGAFLLEPGRTDIQNAVRTGTTLQVVELVASLFIDKSGQKPGDDCLRIPDGGGSVIFEIKCRSTQPRSLPGAALEIDFGHAFKKDEIAPQAASSLPAARSLEIAADEAQGLSAWVDLGGLPMTASSEPSAKTIFRWESRFRREAKTWDGCFHDTIRFTLTQNGRPVLTREYSAIFAPQSLLSCTVTLEAAPALLVKAPAHTGFSHLVCLVPRLPHFLRIVLSPTKPGCVEIKAGKSLIGLRVDGVITGDELREFSKNAPPGFEFRFNEEGLGFDMTPKHSIYLENSTAKTPAPSLEIPLDGLTLSARGEPAWSGQPGAPQPRRKHRSVIEPFLLEEGVDHRAIDKQRLVYIADVTLAIALPGREDAPLDALYLNIREEFPFLLQIWAEQRKSAFPGPEENAEFPIPQASIEIDFGTVLTESEVEGMSRCPPPNFTASKIADTSTLVLRPKQDTLALRLAAVSSLDIPLRIPAITRSPKHPGTVLFSLWSGGRQLAIEEFDACAR